MWTHSRALALASERVREIRGINGIGTPAESSNALEDLGRILAVIEIHREKSVMGGEIERGNLAGAQEVGDVLHLYKWHVGLLKLDAGRDSQVDQPWKGQQKHIV